IAVWKCPNEPAERRAERIRQAFARSEHSGLGEDIRLTASFGVATARKGEQYEELFARADQALYRAKSRGRDRVENAERRVEVEIVPTRAPELIELKRAAGDR
ncbi:MAG: diguanylate cyclase, partial [Pseudomonadota bacterium]